MLVVGIVGPIASGKSVVLSILAELGAHTIRADEISRDLTGPGSPLLTRIAAEFGSEYLDKRGELRRSALGQLIFASDDARERLNAIMHPAMLAELKHRLDEARGAGAAVVAVEAAVLEQMGALGLMDCVVMVSASEDARARRLMARDGLSEAEARRRISRQEQLGLDRTPADFTISTGASLSDTRLQVERFWRELCAQRTP